MDSEWIGRAGILAEAVSFLLIAPEIIGLERLRNAERALEKLGNRWPDWPIPAGTERVAMLFLTLLLALGGFAAYEVATENPFPRNLLGVLLALPVGGTALVLWSVFVYGTAVGGLLRLLERLLTGENRLRALVFGTGVVLLGGGMIAQFAATF